MSKLIVLGTGSATPTKIFNTCFLLTGDDTEYLLVDSGGGVGIFKQLEDAKVELTHIHHLILSHRHADHIFGTIWLIRKIALLKKEGKYEGIFNIYCNDEVANSVIQISTATLRNYQLSEIGKSIIINIVNDQDKLDIMDYKIIFFDIKGQSDKQFGFTLLLQNDKKVVFCGDEPLRLKNIDIDLLNTDYLLHEAFCVDSEASIYKPYEKDHATAKSAAIVAESLGVKNLILWHTEDDDMFNRREKYTNEAKEYYSGNVIIPDDLEIIELD